MTQTDVQINDYVLFPNAGLAVTPGGMSVGGCIAHITVVDTPNKKAYLVPVSWEVLNAIAGEIDFCLKATEGQCPDEPILPEN